MTRPKIGLVLGGGGIRGLAHIGVLEVLHREQIPIDLIVGTSMGGIVGVLFGLGYTPSEIVEEMARMQSKPFNKALTEHLSQKSTTDWAWVAGIGGLTGLLFVAARQLLNRAKGREATHLFDPLIGMGLGGVVGLLAALGQAPQNGGDPKQQLLSVEMLSSRGRQRQLERQLAEALADKTFADLSVPTTVMAVDMLHGCEVPLNEGPLLPIVLASSAVPGAFPPVKYQDMELADGGVIDSLATHVAFEQGAEKVIAVDVYPPLEKQNPWTDPVSAIMGLQLPPSVFSTSGTGNDRIPTAAASMWRSVRVMTWHLHQERLATHPPDVLLCPDVGRYGSLDFKDVTGPFDAGIIEAERHLPQLKALLQT
ncbi:MAG: patatin-like phospholipase family protein [Chloroflexota bacterium]